ncbi:MAG: cyclic peptide export ABC transporter [Bacteroidota bacterium]
MKILYLFLKTSVSDFIIAVLSGIIAGFCMAGMIVLIKQGIDTRLSDFDYLLYAFIGLWFTYGVTSVAASYYVSKLSQTVILDMRVDLSRKIMKASFQSMEHKRNQLLAIFTDDINTVAQAVTRFPNIIASVAMVVGCIVYMATISLELIGLFLLLFGLAYGFFKKPLNNFKYKTRQARDTQKDLVGHFQALIFGLKELLLSGRLRESFVNRTLLPSATEQKGFNIWSAMWLAVFGRAADMILLLGFGSILVIIERYEVVSFETLASFLLISLFTLSPLSNISSFLPFLGKIDVALEQIRNTGLMLEDAAVNRLEESPSFEADDVPYLQLNDVTYTYFHEGEEKFFQLGPINLEINRGEMIYLLGGNGSGKSTLAKIICGLYRPETGTVTMAGTEIKKGTLDAYRENFNAIFTDFFIFDRLDYLPQETVQKDAERYLKLLELDKKVKIEDGKLSTTKLSTGQRKRLALLLSYLDDKPFYIFDEWAASQDPYYKEVFYRTLLPEMKKRGKTLLVISHDEKYFDGADRFIMLRDGQMITKDTNDDLLTIYNQGIPSEKV